MHSGEGVNIRRVAWLLALGLSISGGAAGANAPYSPHVRACLDCAGRFIGGPTDPNYEMYVEGSEAFKERHSVDGSLPNTGLGLGPRFNAVSCADCHSQPAIGGSAPPVNPQVLNAAVESPLDRLPHFLSAKGPVREVRFKSDGAVHQIFTISGRSDAGECRLPQPHLENSSDLAFRIPAPIFGDGLIETITDATISANASSMRARKSALGIAGHENRSANDNTITKFGWKAQNGSLLIVTGEAYNVEMGITNELFPTEQVQSASCLSLHAPNDRTDVSPTPGSEIVVSDILLIDHFLRFLAPPAAAQSTSAIRHGESVFSAVGCAYCHTPNLRGGPSSDEALREKNVPLYSDLLLHRMGKELADGIRQGLAAGDEFRTAPLWGLGQRVFFLHDGRATDLLAAIHMHASAKSSQWRASEANSVVHRFDQLSAIDRQSILDFLRSL